MLVKKLPIQNQYNKTMRKIAIITILDSYREDYDDYSQTIQSITDWAEVTEAELATLKQASYQKGFKILEQPNDQAGFIKATIADYLEQAAKEAKAEEERKEKAAAKRREQELKRRAKTEEQEKKLLADLLKKHGPVDK